MDESGNTKKKPHFRCIDGDLFIDGREVLRAWECASGSFYFATSLKKIEFSSDINSHMPIDNIWYGFIQSIVDVWGEFSDNELASSPWISEIPKDEIRFKGKYARKENTMIQQFISRTKKFILKCFFFITIFTFLSIMGFAESGFVIVRSNTLPEITIKLSQSKGNSFILIKDNDTPQYWKLVKKVEQSNDKPIFGTSDVNYTISMSCSSSNDIIMMNRRTGVTWILTYDLKNESYTWKPLLSNSKDN